MGALSNQGYEIGDKSRIIRLDAPVLTKASSDGVTASLERILVSLIWLPGSKSGTIRRREFFTFDEAILVE